MSELNENMTTLSGLVNPQVVADVVGEKLTDAIQFLPCARSTASWKAIPAVRSPSLNTPTSAMRWTSPKAAKSRSKS